MKRLIALAFVKLTGWRVEGQRPDRDRYVIVAAPHTSNRDAVFMLAIAFIFRIRVNWMVKHGVFRPPYRSFLRWLGAVPIERGRRKGVVDQMIARFGEEESLHLLVPTEGTRSYREYWKSGFYHIARGASVPVYLSFLDYKTKTGGFGPLIELTGDIGADMDKIRAFYAGKVGKHPEKMGRIRLLEEEDARQ